MLNHLPSLRIFPGRCAHLSVSWSLEEFDEAWFVKFGLVVPESMTNAVPKRRAEFLAGRYCAQKSLASLGIVSTDAIPINADRSPKWPVGIVGSITHSGHYAAAVVAHASTFGGIGIDTENVVDVAAAERLKTLIMTNMEMDQLARLPSTRTFAEMFTLIFSGKESIYKCLRPLVGTFFGFHSASLVGFEEVEDDKGVLIFRLSDDLAWQKRFPGVWKVRWQLDAQYAHTCVDIPVVCESNVRNA